MDAAGATDFGKHRITLVEENIFNHRTALPGMFIKSSPE